jgi:YgiT-type zinc finger domain-containing protein
MMCVVCHQAELVNALTSVGLERGELRLVVSDVPARLCPSCGEAYLEEQTARRLLQSAEDTRKAGVQDARYEYSSVEV